MASVAYPVFVNGNPKKADNIFENKYPTLQELKMIKSTCAYDFLNLLPKKSGDFANYDLSIRTDKVLSFSSIFSYLWICFIGFLVLGYSVLFYYQWSGVIFNSPL